MKQLFYFRNTFREYSLIPFSRISSFNEIPDPKHTISSFIKGVYIRDEIGSYKVASYSILFPFYEEYNECGKALLSIVTRRRVQLFALNKAIMVADAMNPSFSMSLRVFTESQSLSRLINETIYEYAANKWFIKNTTTPVKDYDILRVIYLAKQKRDIKLKHVIISEDSTSWFNKNNQLAEDLAMSVYK